MCYVYICFCSFRQAVKVLWSPVTSSGGGHACPYGQCHAHGTYQGISNSHGKSNQYVATQYLTLYQPRSS